MPNPMLASFSSAGAQSAPIPRMTLSPATGGGDTTPAPAAPAAQAAPAAAAPNPQVAQQIAAFVDHTKALDQVWTSSATTAQEAVASLGTNAKADPATAVHVTRISIIGKLLDETLPAQQPAGAKKVTGAPAEVTAQAEDQFTKVVTGLQDEAAALGQQLDPNQVPKELMQAFLAATDKVDHASAAVWAATKLMPAPAAAAAPAGTTPAAPGTPPAAGTALAAAPAGSAAPAAPAQAAAAAPATPAAAAPTTQ